MDIYDQLLDGAGAPAAPQLLPPESHSVYDDVLDQQQAETDQRLRKTLDLASQFNPDQAASASILAKRIALPVEVVERNLPEAQRRTQMDEVARLADSSPVLKKQLLDPGFAKITHDDTDNLSTLESALQFGENTGKALGAGIFAGTAGFVGAVEAVNKNTGDLFAPLIPNAYNPWYSQVDDLKNLRHSQEAWRDYLKPAAESTFGKGAVSGAMSLAQNIPILAAAIYTRSPGLALNAMSAMTFGQTYAEDTDKGINTAAATIHGTANATIEYATEGWSMGKLFGDLNAGSSVLKTMLHQAIPELGGEQAATALQGLTDWTVQHPDKPVKDYLATMPDAAAETLVATVIGMGGNVALLKTLDTVQNRFNVDLGKAKRGDNAALNIERLNKIMAASKVLARDPALIHDFIEQATAKGPVQNLYIDAQTLMQSGVADQLVELLPDVAAQLPEALATGGEVQIPMADYLAYVANTEIDSDLVDHLRVEGEDYTRATGQAYMDEHAEDLQKQVDKALEEHQVDDAFKTSTDNVKAIIKSQLANAGHFDNSVNEAYASLAANFFAVHAQKLGMTPEALYQKYPLKVNSQATGGQVLHQSENDNTSTTGELLDPDKPVKIINISGNEIGDSPISASRVKEWLLDEKKWHEMPSVVNEDTGDAIGFTVKGIKASLKRKSDNQRKAYAGLPELLKNAVLVKHENIKEGKTKDAHLQGYEVYAGALNISGTIFGVKIKVEKPKASLTDRDRSYKDHKIIDIEVLSPAASQGSGDKSPVIGYPEAGPTQAGEGFINLGLLIEKSNKNKLHFNQSPSINRGMFSPSTNTITLLKDADLSTFLHELGHFFLEAQFDMAARMAQEVEALGATPGQQAMLDDTQALLKWFGIDNLDHWYSLDFEEKRAYHEQFARGFEHYLGEGKAPSLELQGLFQRARSWIIAVYQDLKRLNVTLTPEVRGVMDRMIASDEQIKLSEQARSLMPLFESAEQAGMSPAEFADYQQLGEDATNAAIDSLSSKANRDMQWLSNARAKSLKKMQRQHDAIRRDIRSEVRTQVMTQPVYQAWSFLTRKLSKDNEANPKASAGRIDLSALKNMGLPPEMEQRLIDLKMTAKHGLDADLITDLVPGFSSGDEMVRAIAAAEDPKAAIERLTDQTMLERHSELATPEAVQKAADKAISNAVRLRFVASEANALAKATGSTKLLEAAAKEMAVKVISRLKIRAILPYTYVRAGTRAAKAAEKAMAKGNIKAAATEKRNQLINLHLEKTANAALDDVDKMIRYFRRFGGTHNAINGEYLGQINALLDKFDLRKQSGTEIDETTRLRSWVQSRLAAGDLPVVAETLLNPQERAAYVAQIESRDSQGRLVYMDDEERLKLLADAIDRSAKRSYKDATYEELQGLHETIQQIEHLGRLKSKLLTSRDKLTYQETKDKIVVGIIEHGGEGGKNTRTPNDVPGKLLAGIKDFGAAHIKVATWARIMDGGLDNGPVWRYLIKPANARASQETTMRAEATAALDVILRPLLDKVPLADKMGKGKSFKSIPGAALNWQERFAVLLNMGNESNLQRLMSGGIANVTPQLTMPQIMEIVSGFSFEELHAAQRIWDHFESYRPLIAEKELRVTGVEPKWIPIRAISLVANDGKVIALRGGYYPVKFDARVNIDAQGHASAQDAKELMKAAYSAAVTQRSFTKERVPEVHGRPLLLNMTGLYSGVNDVIHDLAWHEWVIDANRLLKSRDIDKAIREHYGPEVKKQFDNWRNDIITGQRKLDHGIEKAAGVARQFVSASGLTFNLMSAAMQPLGLSNSMARIGTQWVGKGVARYISNPIQATQEAQEKSEWLRNRTRTRFRELNELRNQVQGQTAAKELMGRYGYWLMMRSQMMVDIPTWWGGYEKAVAEGHDEETAIALADQGVKDSQGGGEEVDQSGIERGPALVKLFTVFYGFMGTTLNTAYGSTITETSKAKIAVNLLLTLTAAPVLGSLLRSALTPGGGDDDDEDLAGKLIREQISFLMGTIAFGREFSQLANPKSMGYSGPTGLRVIPDIYHLKEQTMQGEFDDAFRKQFINVLGDLTGLPSVQINRTLTGAKAIADGDTINPLAIGFGYKK